MHKAIRVLQLLLLVVLVRHLALAFFIHPYADDFSYAVAGMRVPLVERLMQEYTSWNGRYFSNILILRGPITLGLPEGLMWYRVSAIALILFTGFAFQRLFRAILGPTSRIAISLTLAVFFLALYLHVMPDASEGFYWYTGAMTYQFPNALSLLLIANWVQHAQRGWSSRSVWWIMQVALVAIIAGCNELHMVLLVLGHVGLLIWRRRGKGTWDGHVLAMLLMTLLCALVVAIAPGNGTRSALFPMRHEVLRTIAMSVIQTLRFVGTWLVLSPLGVFTLALFAIHRTYGSAATLDTVLVRVNKWWSVAVPFLVVFTSMVLVYWPTGILGQYRTVNVALFFFLPTWFFATLVWDVQVFRSKGWTLPDARKPVFQWVFASFCAVSFLVFGRDGKLTDDLISGRAQRYDHDIQQGYQDIAGAVRTNAERVELVPTEIPRSLHILPLSTSPDHWTNRSLADYFGNAALNITVRPPAESEE